MVEMFNQLDIDQVVMACRQHGARYGLEFGDMAHLSNTRLSLEAAEFARDNGLYHEFHRAVFKAYFTDARNIGDLEVLLSIADSCGLERGPLATALEEKTFASRVEAGSAEARKRGVRAIPAFFIEDRPVITGAVPEDRFREVLQSLSRQ